MGGFDTDHPVLHIWGDAVAPGWDLAGSSWESSGVRVVAKSIWMLVTVGAMGIGTAAAAANGGRVERRATLEAAAVKARIVELHRHTRAKRPTVEVVREERTITPAPVSASKTTSAVKGKKMTATTDLSRVAQRRA